MSSRLLRLSSQVTAFGSCRQINSMARQISTRIISRPIQLILDFDGTLTKKDTMHIIASAGYKRQKTRTEREMTKTEAPTPWEDIVNAYMDDFSAHARSYQPNQQSRTTIAQELEWLDSLKEVEVASAKRVQQAGVFDNVMPEDMEATAAEAIIRGEVQLRSGWGDLLLLMNTINHTQRDQAPHANQVVVMSVNWSQNFVRNILLNAARSEASPGGDGELVKVVEEIEVFANEIPSIHNARVDDNKRTELRTSGDKVKQLLSIRKRGLQASAAPLSVYVGDSTTDMACLLTAQMGICIRDEPMGSGQKDLAETCTRLGLEVKPVQQLKDEDLPDPRENHISRQEQATHQSHLWHASNFEEILSALASISRSI